MLEAIQTIIDKGGSIYKDNSFYIRGVEGRFGKDKDSLVIIVDEKPWLASWKMIEDKLNGFFN
jgi:hypothetical protein